MVQQIEKGIFHLKNGVLINHEYQFIIKELFPSISDLQAVKNIIAVTEKGEISPGIFSYEVESDKAKGVAGDLSHLVHTNNWRLIEMRTEKMSLENIFIELTREEGL